MKSSTTHLKGIVAICFLLVNFLAYSQDIITQRDGSTIEAKIVEISEKFVRYRDFDYQTGPIRDLELENVAYIEYESGDKEDFNPLITEKEKKEALKDVKRQSYDSGIGKNGFFVDGLVGLGITNFKYENGFNNIPTNNIVREFSPSIGLRLGNKFYFGGEERFFKVGIQATWLRFNSLINVEDIEYPSFIFNLANPGLTTLFNFNRNLGLEVNADFGLSVQLTEAEFGFIDAEYASVGLSFNPNVKFVYGDFRFGIDYARVIGMIDSFDPYFDIIGITVGAKF